MNKILYLLCFLITANASAQYQSNGPNGGLANSLYRQQGGRIWLASNTGVYYSDNNGLNWINPVIPASTFSCIPIQCIAFGMGELYAGTQHSGIYHSTDNGVTWSTVNAGIKTAGANYTDVEISGPNALAIRADSGILMITQDHGISWQNINLRLANSKAFWLSVHNNDLYVNTSQGIFMSPNNGLSFTNINPGINNGKLVWVGDTAYAATGTGILQSLDYGVSFTPIGLSGRNVREVAVFGTRIFATVRSAAAVDTLKYSTDGGLSFTNGPANVSTRTLRTINDLLMPDASVIIATSNGLLHSANGGNTFNIRDSGFHSTVIRGLAVSGTTVYAATSPMGAFVSADSGTTWSHNGNTLQGVGTDLLAIDAAGPHVHAGGTTGYYHSGDNGASWTAGATGLSAAGIPSVYAVKATTNVLLIQGGNLFFSSNNGTSFAPVPGSGLPGGAYYVNGVDTGLFIATSSGLYRAGASTVAFVATSGIIGNVSAVAHNGSAYFAATSGSGLYTSPDGIAWTSVLVTTPDSLPAKINALVADSGSLFAGTDDGLYSNKGGAWHRDSLQGRIVYSLAVRNGYLFAGTCGGVWSKSYPPVVVPNGIAAVQYSSALNVYPNPASGDFRIEYTAAKEGNAVITLRNMIGSTLLQQNVSLKAGNNIFPVGAGSLGLPTGIYLVQLVAGNQLSTQRVVLR